MNSESINYVRDLLKKAYYSGAWDMSQELVLTDNITYELAQRLREAMKAEAARHAKEITIDEKALRCANSERAEGEVTANLHAVPTTPGTCAQLPPLAADLEGLADSLGVLAGNVSSEQWEFLKIFRANLRAAAEQSAALERNLEIPARGSHLLYLASPYSDPDPLVRLARYHEANSAAAKLMAAGYCVISPLSMGVTIAAARPNTLDTSWGAWEDICLRMLECCHTVCILPLPDWKESVGVRAELEHARVLGMRISFVSFLAEGRIDFMDATEWRRQ